MMNNFKTISTEASVTIKLAYSKKCIQTVNLPISKNFTTSIPKRHRCIQTIDVPSADDVPVLKQFVGTIPLEHATIILS